MGRCPHAYLPALAGQTGMQAGKKESFEKRSTEEDYVHSHNV